MELGVEKFKGRKEKEHGAEKIPSIANCRLPGTTGGQCSTYHVVTLHFTAFHSCETQSERRCMQPAHCPAFQ